ncbi:MAG: 1-phosphofructokinase family hexose kinase [Chthonomonadaceae bacterium]|nr:1-phosphofructokinase family hexose kinase [Chthonomonadaceae bacterium]
MIATVTLNPSIDHSLFVKRLCVGDTNPVLRTEIDAGGKGINLARVAAEMGATTLAVGFLGGGPGAYVRRVLDDQGVRHAFVETREPTRENFGVEDESDAPPTTFNARGPRIESDELERLMALCGEVAGKCRWAAMGGSVPPGVPSGIYQELAALFLRSGCRVLVDADGDALREALEAGPDLCKPNAKEASRLLGRPVASTHDAVAAAHEILARQGSHRGRMTIVSLGADGAVLATPEGTWIGETPKVKARSTIGSGDSMLGAFLWALEEGRPLTEAFRWGLAAGAATATTDGSEIARRPVVERLFAEASITAATPP